MKVSVIVLESSSSPQFQYCLEALSKQVRPIDEILFLKKGEMGIEIRQKFPNIRILDSQGIEGDFMEYLINSAHGDYITIKNSDEVVVPEYCERALRLLETYPRAALFSSSGACSTSDNQMQIHDSGWSLRPRFFEPISWAAALRHGHLYTSSVIVRKSSWQSVLKYRSQIESSADWFFFHALGFRYGMVYDPALLCQTVCEESIPDGLGDMAHFANILQLLQGDFQDVCDHFVQSGVLSYHFRNHIHAILKQSSALDIPSHIKRELRFAITDPIGDKRRLFAKIIQAARKLYSFFDAPRRTLRRIERIERELTTLHEERNRRVRGREHSNHPGEA